MPGRDLALALATILIWGVNFVAVRWGLDGLSPMLLGALRFACVAFPAVLFISPPAVPFRWLLAYGLTISFGQFALLFSAMYLGMPAGLASLVLQSQVLFTCLFAFFWLGERWHLLQLLALLVCMIGLGMIASQSGVGGMTLTGFMLTLAAAGSWGLGNVINRKIGQLGPVNPLSLVVWAALIPPLPFLACALYLEGSSSVLYHLTHLSLQSWLSVLYQALAASLLGYSCWAYLLKNYPTANVAPLTLLVPVVGLTAAWALLGERLSLYQWLGIALIMSGLALMMSGPRILAHLRQR